MPYTTYDDLFAGIQAWMEDDDTELQASIPAIIALGETRLARDLDLELFRRTDSTTTLVVGTVVVPKPVIAPPDILIATKDIYLDSAGLARPTFLEQRSYQYVRSYSTAQAVPKFFAELSETEWLISPAPDNTYRLNARYISRPPGLSPTNASNWLSENTPDILLKACLAESEMFLKGDERIAIWKQEYAMLLPIVKRELYNLYGEQYDMLGAVPVPQGPRSSMP